VIRSAWSLAACAAANAPNEWAAMKMDPVARAISRRTRADHSGKCGSFQSRCVTRTLPLTRRSSHVCQWVGPLERSPGTMRVVDIEFILDAGAGEKAGGVVSGLRADEARTRAALTVNDPAGAESAATPLAVLS